MSAILHILAFAVGFLLVQLATHLAWKRRRAKAARPSATVESAGRQLKALYSSAALEEMAKQENPLFTRMTKAGGIDDALTRNWETGIVFKPGKPLNPVPDMLKEPDLEQVSRIMHLEGAASELRMRNHRLEVEVSRLEGVIEGMRKTTPADEPKGGES